MIFWEHADKTAIVARIAIAGDFLPPHKAQDGSPTEAPLHDWTEMAKRLAEHFEDAFLSVVNCEATLDTADLPPQPVCGLGAHISAPSSCLDYLHFLRATAVGIANNHIYDFGPAGLARTRLAVERRGMIPIGAGTTLRAAPEVFVWCGPREIRVGVWAAARATRNAATHASAGVEPASLARGREALDAMRSRGARVCIALLHAGCERTNFTDPDDVELMDGLARSGFDVVAACHSHRVSGARIVQALPDHPAFCFYGLGSIVNGMSASAAEQEGLIIVAGFDAGGELARIELRPVLLAENGFGEVPPREMSEAILLRFRVLSDEIADGSYARLFYRDISRGLFRLYARDARKAFHQAGVRGLARKVLRIRMRHVRRLAHKVLR